MGGAGGTSAHRKEEGTGLSGGRPCGQQPVKEGVETGTPVKGSLRPPRGPHWQGTGENGSPHTTFTHTHTLACLCAHVATCTHAGHTHPGAHGHTHRCRCAHMHMHTHVHTGSRQQGSGTRCWRQKAVSYTGLEIPARYGTRKAPKPWPLPMTARVGASTGQGELGALLASPGVGFPSTPGST